MTVYIVSEQFFPPSAARRVPVAYPQVEKEFITAFSTRELARKFILYKLREMARVRLKYAKSRTKIVPWSRTEFDNICNNILYKANELKGIPTIYKFVITPLKLDSA